VVGSISGSDLASNLLEKAMEFGAVTEFDCVTSVEKTDAGSFVCHGEYGDYEGKAIILATGAHHRKLGIEGEEELTGRGVSYCAVCDGAFFKGKTTCVIGGGSTALADALLLSELCEKVYLVHRRNEFRGEAHVVERLKSKQNVEFLLSTAPEAFVGGDVLEKVMLTSTVNGEKSEISCDGAFVAVGQAPDMEIFRDLIELNEGGYAQSGEDCTTETAGIFVAGDCREKKIRQLTTAVSDGTVAALAACDYVDSL
jgi:thioredoxin reductase (NADPH)